MESYKDLVKKYFNGVEKLSTHETKLLIKSMKKEKLISKSIIIKLYKLFWIILIDCLEILIWEKYWDESLNLKTKKFYAKILKVKE